MLPVLLPIILLFVTIPEIDYSVALAFFYLGDDPATLPSTVVVATFIIVLPFDYDEPVRRLPSCLLPPHQQLPPFFYRDRRRRTPTGVEANLTTFYLNEPGEVVSGVINFRDTGRGDTAARTAHAALRVVTGGEFRLANFTFLPATTCLRPRRIPFRSTRSEQPLLVGR